MTLKQYSQMISKLAEEYPDLVVVYSADEEGNNYDKVVYKPAVGCLTDDGEFIIEKEFEAMKEFGHEYDNLKVNSVCIN